jgi:hypothetical protein
VNAYHNLLHNDLTTAMQGFKGRGYGLTPAGDDFNAGLLLGLKVREKNEKKELPKSRPLRYPHLLGKNLLANTFLIQAELGWLSANWKTMLQALVGSKLQLQEAVNRILNQGETSGADALTGFISAWEVKI